MAGVYFEIDAGNGPVQIEQVKLEFDDFENNLVYLTEGYQAGANIEFLSWALMEAEKAQDDENVVFLSKFLSECRRIPNATVRFYD